VTIGRGLPAGPPDDGPSSPLRIALQIFLTLGAVTLGLWALYRTAAVIFILIAAALFAYVIAPLVEYAQCPVRLGGRRRRLPRPAAIAVVYVLLAGCAGLGGMVLLPGAMRQADEAVARVPEQLQSVLSWQRGWSRYYSRLPIPLEVRQRLDDSAAAASQSILMRTRESLQSLAVQATKLPWLLMTPILALFMLKDAGSIRKVIVSALPFQLRLRSHRLFEDLNAMLAAYVRAQLVACVLVGSLCGVGFAVIGLPYALLLGVLAGAMEFIPMVGPSLLAVTALIVALVHAPVTALWTFGFLATLRVVEDYVIYPRLIRRGLELHPLVVIVGVMAGAELGGVVGMFLAVPVVATATVICRHWLGWRESDAATAALDLDPGMATSPVLYSTPDERRGA
jgi:predicted PurR-regulated permease PerM